MVLPHSDVEVKSTQRRHEKTKKRVTTVLYNRKKNASMQMPLCRQSLDLQSKQTYRLFVVTYQ